MSVQYLGSLSVAALNPAVSVTIMPELSLRLGELTQLKSEAEARLTALQANLQAALGINLPNPIDLTLGLQAQLQAVAQLALQMPGATVNLQASLNAEITAVLALIAEIALKIELLAQLIADLNLALGGAGIAAYAYTGRADQLGDEIDAHLGSGLPGGSGPAEPVQGLVLACSSPEDWAKLEVFLKVT